MSPSHRTSSASGLPMLWYSNPPQVARPPDTSACWPAARPPADIAKDAPSSRRVTVKSRPPRPWSPALAKRDARLDPSEPPATRLPDTAASIRPEIADRVLVIIAEAKCGSTASLTRPARCTGSSVVALATFDGRPGPAALIAETR